MEVSSMALIEGQMRWRRNDTTTTFTGSESRSYIFFRSKKCYEFICHTPLLVAISIASSLANIRDFSPPSWIRPSSNTSSVEGVLTSVELRFLSLKFPTENDIFRSSSSYLEQ